jgi:hypothetical protein
LSDRAQPDVFVPPTVLDRALTLDEDAALRWILWLEDFSGAEELRAQIAHVRAVYGRVTELSLEVTDSAPAPVTDGEISAPALVVDADEKAIGFITVSTVDGFLKFLTYSWFGETMPTEYPSPDRLRLWDPN